MIRTAMLEDSDESIMAALKEECKELRARVRGLERESEQAAVLNANLLRRGSVLKVKVDRIPVIDKRIRELENLLALRGQELVRMGNRLTKLDTGLRLYASPDSWSGRVLIEGEGPPYTAASTALYEARIRKPE